jgi:hypothetical protein
MTNLTTLFPHERLIAYQVACELLDLVGSFEFRIRSFVIKGCALRRVRASISLRRPGDLAGRTRRAFSRSPAARPARLRRPSILRLGPGNATRTLLALRAASRGGSTRC